MWGLRARVKRDREPDAAKVAAVEEIPEPFRRF